jgi:hypothetical protein
MYIFDNLRRIRENKSGKVELKPQEFTFEYFF